jgi:hypothetical protein
MVKISCEMCGVGAELRIEGSEKEAGMTDVAAIYSRFSSNCVEH